MFSSKRPEHNLLDLRVQQVVVGLGNMYCKLDELMDWHHVAVREGEREKEENTAKRETLETLGEKNWSRGFGCDRKRLISSG